MRSDGIEHSRCSPAGGVSPNGGRHIFAGAINHVGRAGGTYGFQTLAAGNADDLRSAIGQECDQHPTYRTGRAPNHLQHDLRPAKRARDHRP